MKQGELKLKKEEEQKRSLNTMLQNYKPLKGSTTSEFEFDSEDDDFEGEDHFFQKKSHPKQ